MIETEFIEGMVAGSIITVIAIFAYFVFVHPEPYYVDCGCGAMSQMCRQCIDGGNLSAPICNYFVRGAP